jgi:hypothetical protein
MSIVVKFPAKSLARKRKVRLERDAREFRNIWDSLPTKEHREAVVAVLYLAAARDASEFVKARKRALAAIAWLPSEAERSHMLRCIARWRPRENVVVRFAG